MAYDANNDPYVDNDTGILRNLLGIATQERLDIAEAEITSVTIATLEFNEQPVAMSFDKELLKNIHREIFGDIYDWAGEFRKIDISKGSSYFSHADYIASAIDERLNKVVGDERLQANNKVLMVEALAEYYSELNAIHPFREGNGRAIRTFLRLLAVDNGWDIEWASMDSAENLDACTISFSGSVEPMRRMLMRLVKRI